ncbi:unnamed protein product [Durusdinium trenchii]|uniref:Apple domain-containing protein n=1 Tax=Durusdinium trenchii TaxID=1381693 RepID=A0ABP0JC12_9DINO
MLAWLLLLPLANGRQLLGHSLNSLALPPRCKVGLGEPQHLLWVDWSLRSPGRIQLQEVQLAWHLPLPENLEEQAIFIAQLRRHGEAFTLQEVHHVPLREISRSEGLPLLNGSLQLVLDDSDLLGLFELCEGNSPVAAGSFPGAFAFTVQGEIKRGRQVDLSMAESARHPAWAFSFIEDHASPVAREGGAVQILARVVEEAKCHNEDNLVKNLRSLATCPWAHNYPIYILHTAQMEGAEEEQLLSWMDGLRFAQDGMDLRFLDVSEDFQRVEVGDSKVKIDQDDLLWFDATLTNSPEIRKAKPRRFQAGYRHMCRFQSSTVLTLPVFQHTRYLLHLDSDATFRCEGSDQLDPFQEMARKDYVYGLFEVGLEDPGCTKGWSNFLKEWVLLNDIELPNPVAALSTAGKTITQVDPYNKSERMIEVPLGSLSLTWGTAWEVLDLDFFTSPVLMHFSKRVEGALGHYRFLWGDHLIRAYQVLLYAPLERVRCFDTAELHGRHGCSADGQFGIEEEDPEGWQNIYSVLDNVSCPHLWYADGLEGVEWRGGPGSGTSPIACLKMCNSLPDCQGFDFVYRDLSQNCDCVMRMGRAFDEECHGGGVQGDAMAPWLPVSEPGATLLGAANRYQIIERMVERQMNCSLWQEEIAERIRRADVERLQDLP